MHNFVQEQEPELWNDIDGFLEEMLENGNIEESKKNENLFLRYVLLYFLLHFVLR